ncbi:hypothetical protein D3C81_1569340 [compost metagenome]
MNPAPVQVKVSHDIDKRKRQACLLHQLGHNQLRESVNNEIRFMIGDHLRKLTHPERVQDIGEGSVRLHILGDVIYPAIDGWKCSKALHVYEFG